MSDDLTVRVSVNAFDEPDYDNIPNARPKDQWVEMTGGFKLGESKEQFENRQAEILAIRNRIARGEAKPRDIDRLSHLLGTDDEHEPFPDFG